MFAGEKETRWSRKSVNQGKTFVYIELFHSFTMSVLLTATVLFIHTSLSFCIEMQNEIRPVPPPPPAFFTLMYSPILLP